MLSGLARRKNYVMVVQFCGVMTECFLSVQSSCFVYICDSAGGQHAFVFVAFEYCA